MVGAAAAAMQDAVFARKERERQAARLQKKEREDLKNVSMSEPLQVEENPKGFECHADKELYSYKRGIMRVSMMRVLQQMKTMQEPQNLERYQGWYVEKLTAGGMLNN